MKKTQLLNKGSHIEPLASFPQIKDFKPTANDSSIKKTFESSKLTEKYWLNLLTGLCGINSATKNIAGVNRIQDFLEKELANLGMNTRRVVNPEGEKQSGYLLVGELEGTTDDYITLICHADIVDVFKGQPPSLQRKGNRIYGPGVIDDKGGIVVALRGLTQFIENISSKPKKGIRFVCSPNEETGSIGFHETFRTLASDSSIVLGFEPPDENGNIVIGRKGNRWYDISISGKSAHSGRSHHLGVNACSELAHKLSEFYSLTNYEKEVTVNVGKIEGGSSHNVVSDYAYGQIDIRFPCLETREQIVQKIEENLERSTVQCRQGIKSTNITYEIVDDCPPFSPNSASKAFFQSFKKIITSLEGKAPQGKCVGGAADSNYFSTPGKIILDGLGAMGGGMHTKNEFLYLPSLSTRSSALVNLLNSIEQGSNL